MACVSSRLVYAGNCRAETPVFSFGVFRSNGGNRKPVLPPIRDRSRETSMWDIKVAGTDLYHIINWFFIYSFLGWVWESSYVSVKEKKLVNRGFVAGPVCTIYGFGAVAVYLILKPLTGNPVWLYLGGVVVPTLLEYVTSVLMELVFHTRWWDYSKNRFQLHGRICLGASLGWGVFTLALFYLFQPAVDWFVSLYSIAAGKAALAVIMVLYGIDFAMSYAGALEIGKKLRSLDEVMDGIYDFIQSTKAYEEVEELRGRLAFYRLSEYTAELRKRLETRKDAVIAFTSEPLPEGLRIRMEEQLTLLQSRYEQLKNHKNPFARRMLNAYPNMKSKAQAFKERASQKLNQKRR